MRIKFLLLEQVLNLKQDFGPEILLETKQKMKNRKNQNVLFLLGGEFCACKEWT